jgi:hypothetical protein
MGMKAGVWRLAILGLLALFQLVTGCASRSLVLRLSKFVLRTVKDNLDHSDALQEGLLPPTRTSERVRRATAQESLQKARSQVSPGKFITPSWMFSVVEPASHSCDAQQWTKTTAMPCQAASHYNAKGVRPAPDLLMYATFM